MSNEAKRFIKAALTWEPEKRPWSHELQSYSFISNRNEMEESSLIKSRYMLLVCSLHKSVFNAVKLNKKAISLPMYITITLSNLTFVERY